MTARLGPRFYLTAVVKESGESLVRSLWHEAEIVEYVCNDGNMPTQYKPIVAIGQENLPRYFSDNSCTLQVQCVHSSGRRAKEA